MDGVSTTYVPACIHKYKYVWFMWGSLLLLAGLKAFIQFITGSPVPVGSIIVSFTDHEEVEAVVANTCGRQLTLSTLIEEEDVFVSALLAIVPGRQYTMP